MSQFKITKEDLQFTPIPKLKELLAKTIEAQKLLEKEISFREARLDTLLPNYITTPTSELSLCQSQT